MRKLSIKRNALMNFAVIGGMFLLLAACGGQLTAAPTATLGSTDTPANTATFTATFTSTTRPTSTPANWVMAENPTAFPAPNYPALDGDPEVEAKVAQLLAQMTLEEKIGQMTQAEFKSLAVPEDVATYFLGSILSGGDGNPDPNTAEAWADQFDQVQKIALTTRLKIPIIYGIDSVHGFSHTTGSTIFPHNIGLGATNDQLLVREIGRVTALEMVGTGIRWTFSPCLCVARDEHWGRTYESFSEDPALVSKMAIEIEGYQGGDLGLPTSVLATAKHYIGDGGTLDGIDQGNVIGEEAELLKLFQPPYQAAMKYQVGSVMISFSSWNGDTMHGHKHLITDVLKGEMVFKGIVISDWKGINKIPGTYADQVRTSVNAGIDMFMVPDDYMQFFNTLKSEVEAGRVSEDRINDAVTRILRIKYKMKIFENPLAAREYLAFVGSAEHRAIARQAVRESIVLLKNENSILPLSKSGLRILVTGKNADNIGNQLGGWSLTWQGKGGNVTKGTTILAGIKEVVGGQSEVIYDQFVKKVQGDFDVAIAVIGETPYAEFRGDATKGLSISSEDATIISRLKEKNIPTVVVMISGRPIPLGDSLKDMAALLAAWLPGTEGAGVADVLFGDYKPTGKLSFTWPKDDASIPINVGDPNYDPLFPFGFGLTY